MEKIISFGDENDDLSSNLIDDGSKLKYESRQI
jgi:hypothetical protein